jgi:hypothetical protein
MRLTATQYIPSPADYAFQPAQKVAAIPKNPAAATTTVSRYLPSQKVLPKGTRVNILV